MVNGAADRLLPSGRCCFVPGRGGYATELQWNLSVQMSPWNGHDMDAPVGRHGPNAKCGEISSDIPYSYGPLPAISTL